MINQRLTNLIEEELRNVYEEGSKLLRRRKTLVDVLSGDLDVVEKKLDAKKVIMNAVEYLVEQGLIPDDLYEESISYIKKEIPEEESTISRAKLVGHADLDYTITMQVFGEIYVLIPDVNLPEEYDPLRGEAAFASELIFDYFVKGKIRRLESKLPAYKKTISEISEDETLKDSPLFLNAIKLAYERIWFELKDVSPPVLADNPSEIYEKMDKPSLEKYYLKLRNMRIQEKLIEALSRIYNRYKKGFD